MHNVYPVIIATKNIRINFAKCFWIKPLIQAFGGSMNIFFLR